MAGGSFPENVIDYATFLKTIRINDAMGSSKEIVDLTPIKIH